MTEEISREFEFKMFTQIFASKIIIEMINRFFFLLTCRFRFWWSRDQRRNSHQLWRWVAICSRLVTRRRWKLKIVRFSLETAKNEMNFFFSFFLILLTFFSACRACLAAASSISTSILAPMKWSTCYPQCRCCPRCFGCPTSTSMRDAFPFAFLSFSSSPSFSV